MSRYTDSGARTAADRMCDVARFYNISPKADHGDIFIVHDQKSSYRNPYVRLIYVTSFTVGNYL